MDPSTQCCPNLDCPARGQVGHSTITVHSWKERRYRCQSGRRTFAATTGTPLFRLQSPAELVLVVLSLLSYGCPVQAIVVTFGLDERTVAGDHLSFTKNKNYWQSGKLYLDDVNVAIVKDPEAMSLQLESGALDAIYTPPLQNGGRWQKDPKFQVSVDDPNGYFFTAAVNVAKAPFDNKMVRQAINYALDP